MASFMHKSVVVDKNNLSSTIDDGAMHNSKSATAQKGHESAVELNESIQAQSDPRESMVLTKSRPKSGRKGHKKIKKIKKSDNQSRQPNSVNSNNMGPEHLLATDTLKHNHGPNSSSSKQNNSKRSGLNRSHLNQYGQGANSSQHEKQ